MPILIKHRLLIVLLSTLITGCNVIKPATNSSTSLNLMSLNVYGWKTMPQHAGQYAQLIQQENADIVLIQEGVDDWQLKVKMPVDYSRSNALQQALGQCWQRRWQMLINHCQGMSFINSERFDLADGPNATRTGETATIKTPMGKLTVLNVHWDHQSESIRQLSAQQTAKIMNQHLDSPQLLVGDFNSQCQQVHHQLSTHIKVNLIADGGIDCMFSNKVKAQSKTIPAPPSDHPAVVAYITQLGTNELAN